MTGGGRSSAAVLLLAAHPIFPCRSQLVFFFSYGRSTRLVLNFSFFSLAPSFRSRLRRRRPERSLACARFPFLFCFEECQPFFNSLSPLCTVPHKIVLAVGTAKFFLPTQAFQTSSRSTGPTLRRCPFDLSFQIPWRAFFLCVV